MTPEDRFLSNLPLIERILAAVCRRNGLVADEREEFAAWAKLRLVENDYAILRKFEGRSSLPTYLTTVIANLFRDYRIHCWGKWRPSAEAVRLGPFAVRYETLVHRDGRSLIEAFEILRRENSEIRRADLEDLAGRLPVRTKRRTETDDRLETMPGPESSDSLATDTERRGTENRLAAALNSALSGLEPEARLVLKLRFADGLAVVDIARMLGVPPRPLYTMIERSLVSLRGALASVGLEAAQVLDLVGWPGLALAVDYGPGDVDSERRPSNLLEQRP